MQQLAKVFSTALVGLFTLVTFSATAHTPKNGLGALAVKPDGSTVVTGGDSRVLFVIDANSLEVKKRIWTGTTIWQVAFNKKGDRLLLEDTSEKITFYDTTTWEPAATIKKGGYFHAAPEADLIATKETGWKTKGINFYGMSDAQPKGNVKVDNRIVTFALSPDGKKCFVLIEVKDPTEKKISASDRPKELNGVAKAEFLQKHDGRESDLVVFDVATGKELRRHRIYYRPSASNIKMFIRTNQADQVYILSYNNENALVNSAGEVEIFQTQNSYNYGSGVSADSNIYLTGGLRKATYVDLNDKKKNIAFEIDSIAGWPEYFKSFAIHSDGSAYGTTSAFRIIKISASGKVEKTNPVY